MKELTLRELQLAQFKILENTVDFLEKHKLRYFLYGGTLLGAVRHKGFIPWDDDIDIAMTRPEYEKLLKIVKKEGGVLPNAPECEIQTMETSDLLYPIGKVIDKNVITKSTASLDKNLWIDIFPLDGLPENPKVAVKEIEYLRKLKIIMHIRFTSVAGIMKENKSLVNRLVKVALKPLVFLIPPRKVVEKMRDTAKAYPFEKATFCCGHAWENNGWPQRLRRTIFEDVGYLEFEGRKFMVPKEYEEYLVYMYGDYMKVPPKSEWETHATKAYRVDS